ncbi:MAG: efflux RND transporter permease subunit, partial [Bacteroidia bacterium]|nr:efflux RND transporter permease subunit [Bacteroidia bacterium]
MKSGLAEKLARPFIHSKLTLLLMISFLAVGIYSFFLIPREEEPQINVPMVDAFFMYPGASAEEVESRISAPIEKVISNIKGVEYVYTTSMDESAMVIVQFYVGENTEESLVKLHNEINRNMDKMPYGVTPPLIKSRAIDDVPMMSLTLWSDNYDDFEIKRMAEELTDEIEKTQEVATTNVIGGRSREIKVIIDKEKMAGLNQDILTVVRGIQANNSAMNTGSIRQSDREFVVSTGSFLTSKEDIENLVIDVANGAPIYLKQVATVIDGPQESDAYVSFAYGAGEGGKQINHPGEHQAVTISVSKKKGADAMLIAETIESKLESLQGRLIPGDVYIDVSRNYGQTASEKVSELLMHLMGAILAVTFVVMLAMGWRGGLVVFLSVPITFALTFFSYYFLDYTLNRITLFALVFVTGIVVDDSIIIAENMHRHFRLRKMSIKDAAIYAVNEVGNPTILATFTVIAAVLPMAFVSGMMGPYMSPMPIGASIAMIFSLLVAFTITPYLAFYILNFRDSHADDEPFVLQESRLYRIYNKLA